MEKIMPLELLASIKGATSSEAVNELFDVIKNAIPEDPATSGNEERHLTGGISLDDLRSDEVDEGSTLQRELIKKNFPAEKNGFLVVPKVIED
jgi:Asp-tRNA(Asn)/Glu-tRNA(Gln) amidotransferase C subunit